MSELDELLKRLPKHTPSHAVVARTLENACSDTPPQPARVDDGTGVTVDRWMRDMVREQRSVARWTLGYAFGLTVAFIGFAVMQTHNGATDARPRVLDGATIAQRGVAAAELATQSPAGMFASVRRYLERGELPPSPMVRADAMVDYFQYTDVVAEDGAPLGLGLTSMPAPWDASRRLVRLGVIGRERLWNEHVPTSLVLALDVAALMRDRETASVARDALAALVATLDDRDSVTIVDVGGGARVVLPSTNGARHSLVSEALARLASGAGVTETLSSEGLQTAYASARATSGFGRVGHVVVVGATALRIGSLDFGSRVSGYVRHGVRTSVLAIGSSEVDGQLAELAASGVRAELQRRSDTRELFLDPMMRTMLPAAHDVGVTLVAKSGHVRALSSLGATPVLAQLGAGQVATALYEVEGNPALEVRVRFTRPERHVEERVTLDVAAIPNASDDDSKVAAAAAAFALALRSGRPSEAYAYLDGASRLLASTSMPTMADERDRRLELTRLVGKAREVWRAGRQ